MQQEAPGGGVSLRRKEVAPILPDEPGAEESRSFGTASQFPEVGEAAGEEHYEYRESERELVDAKAADEDPWAEPVPFEAEHCARLDPAR